MKNALFYTNLVNQQEQVSQLLTRDDLFHRFPDDWYVVITDIKGSTASIENGLSEIVNLIATGSIIAALNIANKHTIDIPFFFGGDGATMIIPPNLLDEIMEALNAHKKNIEEEFDIHLRVGSISVSDIYENNQELKVVKVSLNKLLTIPVVLGNGLHFAEKLIKSRDVVLDQTNKKHATLNLDGMECRWNKIPPPENTKEVVSFLISTLDESKQASVFQAILEKTDAVYGSLDNRNPISVPKLELNFSYKKIKTELTAHSNNFGILEFLKVWIVGFLGKYYYLPSRRGQRYLEELTQLSDILVIDGRINMVISGTAKQRAMLVKYLDELEESELIVYGLNVSKKSIMSCYVRNRKAKHIHFVDGGSSGYNRAAKVLKKKYAEKGLSL